MFLLLLSHLLAAAAVLAGLALLLAALWSVRVTAFLHGAWDGSLSSPRDARLLLEYGFPGFMRRREWPDADDATAADAAPDARATAPEPPPPSSSPPPSDPPAASATAVPSRAASPAGTAETPRAPEPPPVAPPHAEDDAKAPPRGDATGERGAETARDPNRWRKALFRLATDGPAWTGLARYVRRVLRLAVRLLHARVELALAHPDPALLGRTAGHWYAFTGPTPLRHVRMNFRFCAPHPAVTLQARGGFSALELAVFAMAALATFPWFRLARRMRWSWRHREPQGWRGRLYRLIQSA